MSHHTDRHEKSPATTTDISSEEKERLNDQVDQQSEESFPASDAPSFTPVTSVSPPKQVDEEDYTEDESFPMRRKQAG